MTTRDIDDDGDELRYSRFDRSAKPIASKLAGLMKTTFPHAKGTLSEFWDACGDPRELEALLLRGERRVILTGQAARIRFRVASEGHDIDLDVLVELRVLERLGPDTYRVRGMWRYFKPIEARLEARKSASAAGKASAEARRKRFGTAQPCSGGRSEGGSEPVRTDAEPNAEPNAERVFERPPEQDPKIPNRTEPAVSGKQLVKSNVFLVAPTPARPGPAERVFDHWRTRMKKPRAKLDPKRERLIKQRLGEGHSEEDLIQAVDGYAKSPFHNGENESRKKYLGLELIMRDTAHVEAGLEYLTKAAPRTKAL